jgi:hypothetical protein
MHDKIAAGKFTDIRFDDDNDNKLIEGVAKIIDDDEWQKCKEGVNTGFSIGGSYPLFRSPALTLRGGGFFCVKRI